MNGADVLTILTLFITESLLSVDNAAVLAILVQPLPEHQHKKALRYGLLGAYVFRGLALLFASWLIKWYWLKVIGGLYLLKLSYDHFKNKEEGEEAGMQFPWLQKLGLSALAATIVVVEINDMLFSIDNVFAAVALTSNIYLILTGVFLGILAMRFIALWFVGLMARHPVLVHSAFTVIGLLGLKLIMDALGYYLIPQLYAAMHSHVFEVLFSTGMLMVFFIPVVVKR